MNDREQAGDPAADRIPGLEDLAADPALSPEPSEPSESAPGDAPADGGLSERDLEILDFERQWWKHAGAKERAVRDRFGCSPTRYYQALNALLDRPEALRHDPVLVQRLRRLRAARQQARSAVRRPPGS